MWKDLDNVITRFLRDALELFLFATGFFCAHEVLGWDGMVVAVGAVVGGGGLVVVVEKALAVGGVVGAAV